MEWTGKYWTAAIPVSMGLSPKERDAAFEAAFDRARCGGQDLVDPFVVEIEGVYLAWAREV